ncbi:coiled-coil domain-containing protein [Legionella fallonii]|uniref:Uncharacterized protein n=1 Tax=Legionella fallonii LLAP-10 TaxID=1212491 RepID=A0A098G4N5_9GAMM|nr:hypothetical protein [Legionella fallonii]CEG56931.1 protein of unknown function [9 coiled coil domains] [Legionella fallonii LLAP-10]
MPKNIDLTVFSQLLGRQIQDSRIENDNIILVDAERDVSDRPVLNPNYFLFMLGTDTVYTHLPTTNLEKEADRKSYENGETLSYTARVVATKMGELEPDLTGQPLSFSTPSVDVVNGPTTRGTEVGERIALGLFLVLKAIAEGKENIVIPAHSRGAVETILMLHELDRVKTELKQNPKKSLYTILLESPCYYTRNAVAKFFKDVKEADNVRASLSARLSNAKVNAFLMDPVPGGRYMFIPGIAWRDDRFFQKPPSNAAELLIFRDERSRCFKPIIPSGLTPIVTPGHHGTASGNIYTQQMYPVVVEKGANDTSTVQQLAVGKLLNFINKHTGLFDSPTEEINLEHPKLDALTNRFLNKSQAERSKLLLDLYQRVHENDAAYKLLAKGGYAYLGTESAKAGTRLVHYGAHNSMGLDTVVTSLDGQFVNAEHASLYLHDQMEFSLDDDKDELDTLTSKFSVVLTKLFQGFKDDNAKIKALLEETPQRKVTFQALLVFVDSISQKYLRNHLSEETKTNLLREIDTIFGILESFKTVTAEDSINGIITECEEMLRLGIQKTANSHYSALLDQTVKLEKESEYFLAPNEEFASVFDSFLKAMEAKLSEENEVTGLLQTIYGKLSSVDPVTVKSVGKALQDEVLALSLNENESAPKAIGVLSELVTDKTLALDRYLDAEIPNKDVFFAELNRVYDNLVSLINGHLHVQKIVGKEKLEFTPRKLAIHQEAVIKLAAQILLKKKIDLHDKPDSMDVEFFKKVKAQAIALGADNPDIIDLQRLILKLGEEKQLVKIGIEQLVKEHQTEIEKLHQVLDEKLEQEKTTHGKEKEQLSLTIDQLHSDIESLNRTNGEKLRQLEVQLETAESKVNELQTELQQLDVTSKEAINELRKNAETAAREYREELAHQQQAAERTLNETTQRLTSEKEELQEQLRLAHDDHQQDKEQAGEAIKKLQTQLQQLDVTSKEAINELRKNAETAAREYREELAHQQQAAERTLNETTQRLTSEKEELQEQLRLAHDDHQQDKEQAGEAIKELQTQLQQLDVTSKETINELRQKAETAAREHSEELVRQQHAAERTLNEATQRFTFEKEELQKQLRLAEGEHQQDQEKADEAIKELQTQLQQLDITSKEAINELRQKAETAAKKYSEELAHQQQVAESTLNEATQRFTFEKEELQKQLRLAEGEHQQDQEKADEAIKELQTQLQQLDVTSKEAINELRQKAETAAKKYSEELAHQQQAAESTLNEATQRFTFEKEELQKQLRLAEGEHQQDQEKAVEAIKELQTQLQQLDVTSKETINELRQKAETAAKKYSEELAHQQQVAESTLNEATQRFTFEKEELQKQLRLAEGEHQQDQEKADEAIKELQTQLQQLDVTSKEAINELRQKAETAAKKYSEELAHQQQVAESILNEATKQLTTEKAQLQDRLEKQLLLAQGAHQQDQKKAGEAIKELRTQLQQLDVTSKDTIRELQQKADTAAQEHSEELARQQKVAERVLKETIARLTNDKNGLEVQLNKKLELSGNAHEQDKAQFEREIKGLQQQLASLKSHISLLQEQTATTTADAGSQLKMLQAEQQKQAKLIADLQTEKERTCFNIIAEQLLPLTKEYAAYLEREALKVNPSFTPTNYKTPASFTGLPADQEKYAKVIAKYSVVQNLLIDLTDKDAHPLPSERITYFTKSLKKADVELKQHRDAEWIKYFNASMVALVVCTGILPGLLVLLTYAAVKGNPFRLFTQSKGEQFVDKVDYSLSDLHKGKSIGFFTQVEDGLSEDKLLEDELSASSKKVPPVA